jgi:hypothetical protein
MEESPEFLMTTTFVSDDEQNYPDNDTEHDN